MLLADALSDVRTVGGEVGHEHREVVDEKLDWVVLARRRIRL